jgi:hypothetical protein
MWVKRRRAPLGLAAIIGILGGAIALLAGAPVTAQAPKGGDTLFTECFSRNPDSAEQAFWRAECDAEAVAEGYQSGVWRPYLQHIDGAVKKCGEGPIRWSCAGVPSEDAGPPSDS